MNLRWSTLLMVVVVAACAGGVPAPVAPKPSREALAARSVEWAKRDPAAPIVPPAVKRLELIITPGWTKDERIAWLISDGSDVIAVYSASSAEVGQIVNAAIQVFYPTGTTASTPLDKLSFNVAGSIVGSGPHPPGPPGFPPDYIEQVIRTAWVLDRDAAAHDAKTAGAAH